MANANYTGPKTAGINLEACHATQKHELGAVVEGTTAAGNRAKFMYVKFLDAIAYLAGHFVCDADPTNYFVSNQRASATIVTGRRGGGLVFQQTVPTQNQFGWIQVGGLGTFIAGATVTAGDLLMPHAATDGQANVAAVGTNENIFGYAKANVASGASGLCQLTLRGV